MRARFTNTNKILFTLILGFSILLTQKAHSGEFVIMNGTYTFTADNGGMFANAVYPPFSSPIPSNWLSPNDYWNGSFRAYYEVISVPTNEPFGFQMGIFQYIYPNDGINFRETCSLIIPPLQGVGSIADVNYGAPANWWQHWNGSVDFSKPNEFQSIGPCAYSLVPGARGGLYPTAWGGDDAAWALRANWFPCTVRIIIVAVSSGSTFSGWSNYMGGCSVPAQPGTISGTTNPTQGSSQTYSIADVSGATNYTWTLPSGWTGTSATSSITTTVGSSSGTIYVTANNACGASTTRSLAVTVGGGCTPAQQATPTYAVDYVNWKTDKVVPSTDEYSYSSDMSGAVSGTGQKLTLTAGQTVYFRTKKASDCLLASNIQTLVVENCTPVQQATPTYGISYGFETTNVVVPATDEYSYSSNMASAVSGTGQKLYLTPGTDVYFRTKASGNCLLASTIQHLVVPARPAKPSISVDFISEKTYENASSNIYYSTSSSYTNPITGTGDKITLTPGQDIYLWVKPTASAFASMDYHLVVPNRPATPSVTFDYFNEVTSVIPVTQEWSTGASMISATSGTNATILVTPGTDLYFRTKATASAFKSEIQSLDVPNRPLAPNYLIDYSAEKTSAAVPSTDEYSIHSDMSSPSAGAGAALTLTPGTNLYFRTKATAGTFKSATQSLVVPNRPATPNYMIDYAAEKTSTAISSTDEYSNHSDMSTSSAGAGAALILMPGTNLYFRTKATAIAFKSAIQSLDVPNRPATPNYLIDYENETTSETVDNTIEYAAAADMTSPATGAGVKLTLIPGEDKFFRVKATASSFTSLVYQLVVPGRPELEYSGNDTVTSATITMRAILDEGMTDFDLTDLTITNGHAQNLQADNIFDVIGEVKGFVTVKIPFNKFDGASFASNLVEVYYNKVVTEIPELESDNFIVYPNPAKNGIIYIQTKQDLPYSINIYSVTGALLRKDVMKAGNNRPIDLQDLSKGTYFLKIITTNVVKVEKIILE
jgi:hypothetical protein